jgi:hypothetical protein
MTRHRASAYRRVLRTLREIGPAQLHPAEQTSIREAADALLFCSDLDADVTAHAALATIAVLTDDLIDAQRWSLQRAQRLLDDIWACGPVTEFELPLSA